MRKSKKLIAALLALLMLCSVLPMSVFAADSHTVRYVLNYNGAPKIESKNVADGETAPYVDGSGRSGWFFTGWSLAKRGELYDFSTPVTEDITLYAQWTQNKASANAAMQRVLAQIANAQKPESEPDEEQYLSDDSPYHFTVDVMGEDTEKALASLFFSYLYEESSGATGSFGSAGDICGTNQIRLNVKFKKGDAFYIISGKEFGSTPYYAEDFQNSGEKLKSGVDSRTYTLAYDKNTFYCMFQHAGKTYMGHINFICYEAAWQLVYTELDSRSGSKNTMFLTALEGKNNVALRFDTPLANIKFTSIPWYRITTNEHAYYSYGGHPLAAGLNKFALVFTTLDGEKQSIGVTVQNGESDYENPYTDITINHPYYNEITYCKQNGYMNGVGADIFAPGNDITNETLAVVLYRIAGSPEAAGDSEGAKAVAWAKTNSLFYSAEADAKDYVTRFELAHTVLAFVKLRYPTFVYQMSGAYYVADMEKLADEVKNTLSFALSIGAVDAFVNENVPTFETDVLVQRAELARVAAALKQYVFYVLDKNPDAVDKGTLFY